MNYFISCLNMREHHRKLLEDTFDALMEAGLTSGPSQAQSGPDTVNSVGYEFSRKVV